MQGVWGRGCERLHPRHPQTALQRHPDTPSRRGWKRAEATISAAATGHSQGGASFVGCGTTGPLVLAVPRGLCARAVAQPEEPQRVAELVQERHTACQRSLTPRPNLQGRRVARVRALARVFEKFYLYATAGRGRRWGRFSVHSNFARAKHGQSNRGATSKDTTQHQGNWRASSKGAHARSTATTVRCLCPKYSPCPRFPCVILGRVGLVPPFT